MNEITRQDAGASRPTEQAPREETLLPAVDIHEQNDAVHIVADMPGVTRESLVIEVDNGVLSLEGEVQIAMPEGLSPAVCRGACPALCAALHPQPRDRQ